MIEPGHGFVLVARAAGVPVAAAVFLVSNGRLVYKFGASRQDAWSLRPNHAIFSEAMTAAWSPTLKTPGSVPFERQP